MVTRLFTDKSDQRGVKVDKCGSGAARTGDYVSVNHHGGIVIPTRQDVKTGLNCRNCRCKLNLSSEAIGIGLYFAVPNSCHTNDNCSSNN